MAPKLVLIRGDTSSMREHGIVGWPYYALLRMPDVVVTSPPYFERDGYSDDLMIHLGSHLSIATCVGARIWVVFGQVGEDLFRPFSAAALIAGSWHLRQAQTVAWVKSIAIRGKTHGHYQPMNPASNLFHYAWEPVFQFINGVRPARKMDRLAVGVPYADKGNLGRGTRGKNGDVHCAGDAWFVPYSTTGHSRKKHHRHSYPVALATRAIRASNLRPGSLVYDPFMGGGTTAVAALRLGFDVVGVDRDLGALEHTEARWLRAGGKPVDITRIY